MIRQMIQEAGVENVLMEYDVGLGDNKKIDIWFRDPDPDNYLQPYFMVDPTAATHDAGGSPADSCFVLADTFAQSTTLRSPDLSSTEISLRIFRCRIAPSMTRQVN